MRAWEEFWGAPPGVSRKRWNNLRTMRMGGVLLIVAGLASGCLGVLGMFGQAGGEETPLTPLSEAASATGRVRVQGRLHADAPVRMPDDGAAVIRGTLRVSLTKGDGGPAEVLEEWAEDASAVVITDGSASLPVAVETLPREEDRTARGTLTRTAQRGGQPEHGEYGGQSWDFDPERYEHGTWRLDVERTLLAQDEMVVATGQIVDGRLVPTSGTELDIERGTADEVEASHGRTRVMLACLGPLMLLVGVFLTIFASVRMAKARAMGLGKIGGMLGG